MTLIMTAVDFRKVILVFKLRVLYVVKADLQGHN